MTERRCTICNRNPVGDQWYACKPCIERFRERLTDLPDLMKHVADAVLKLMRRGDGIHIKRTGGDEPLPFDEPASITARNIRHTINRTAQIHALSKHTPVQHTWTGIAHLLSTDASQLAGTEAGAQDMSRVLDAITRAYRLIDRHPDRRYAGQCNALIETDGEPATCGHPLYGIEQQPEVTCRRCGTTHDVEARRRAMLEAIGDQPLTAGKASQVLGIYGMDVPPSTIRRWAGNGQLEATSHAGGSALYPLRDILQLHINRTA